MFLLFALTASADVRVLSGAVLIEPGQAAPVLKLRNIGTNGTTWELGVSGWTMSAEIERRRFFANVALTPLHAHSSNRIYVDGHRARELEFDSSSYIGTAGMRFHSNDRMTTELAGVLGRDESTYAGVTLAQRYRRVTASDPFDTRIDGVELSALGELYSGGGTWSRLTLMESAGRTMGRVHLRQSAAVVAGSHLNRVRDFLLGGSWDALGPTAIFGRHYAEYRVTRGIVANAGADYTLTPRWTLGARVSAFRAPSADATGAALQTTMHIRGAHVTVGVANRGLVYGSVSAAAFLRR
ncbi:MAG TPA: hypothetical protein VJZ00_01425 [Thermoanaerobaculia bacterium]|nr:hypothetical protein [Thermoanaerobaculia bacterium]